MLSSKLWKELAKRKMEMYKQRAKNKNDMGNIKVIIKIILSTCNKYPSYKVKA